MKRLTQFVAIISLAAIGAEASAQQASQNPAPDQIALPGDVHIRLGDTSGQFEVEGQVRLVWGNSLASSPVSAVYEPAFLPYANLRKIQAQHRICLDVKLDDHQYAALAARAAPTRAGGAPRLLRLPILSATFSLGPSSEGDPAYDWAPPVTLNSSISGATNQEVCFQPPANLAADPGALARLAETATLRILYVIRTTETTRAACDLTLQVENAAVFSNKINGPVKAGGNKDLTVYLTRNQMADALSRGLISMTSQCQSDAGGAAQRRLVGEEAARLMPIVLTLFQQEQKPWSDAMAYLANFSFNGSDAGARITDYLDKLSDKLDRSNATQVEGGASGTGKVLGIAEVGGAVNGKYFRDSKESEQHDLHFEWKGSRIIPASLDVVVLHSASGSSLVRQHVSEEVLGRQQYAYREQRVKVQRADYQSPQLVGIEVPIGTVSAYAGDVAVLPSDWMVCAGGWVRRGSHEALFRAIGDTYGSRGQGNDQEIQVPDYRGFFLRGLSGEANNDPGRRKDDAKMNRVGSIEAATVGDHRHEVLGNGGGPGEYIYLPSGFVSRGSGSHVRTGHVVDTDASETRPMNQAVQFVIRVGYEESR